MRKAFPTIFLTSLLLISILAALFLMQMKLNQSSPNRQKYKLGLVGNLEDSYLGFGIQIIQHLDSSRFVLEFLELKEEEAKSLLKQGEIVAYIKIPDGFLSSIVTAENKAVTLVTGYNQETIGTEIFKELASSVSVVVIESQAAMCTAYQVYDWTEHDGDYKNLKQLNLKYFDLILGRENLYDLQQIGGTQGISWKFYFLCSAILIFLMFWGITSASILVKKDMALPKLLAAHKIGPLQQTIGEFVPFYLFMLCNTLGILLPLYLLIKYYGTSLFQTDELEIMFHLLLGSWLLILCISSLLYLIYNISKNLISGVLLNFIIALFMGYLSGCFYPISYFPPMIQKISSYLPTGIGMHYMKYYIIHGEWGKNAIFLLLYTFLFLLLSMIIRKIRLEKNYDILQRKAF